MSKFDYFLGALLSIFGLFLILGPSTHWSVATLFLLAITVFVLFIVRLKKERCKHCGHYFQRNIMDRYLIEKNSKKCSNCQTSAFRDDQPNGGMAA